MDEAIGPEKIMENNIIGFGVENIDGEKGEIKVYVFPLVKYLYANINKFGVI